VSHRCITKGGRDIDPLKIHVPAHSHPVISSVFMSWSPNPISRPGNHPERLYQPKTMYVCPCGSWYGFHVPPTIWNLAHLPIDGY
jgi:hypothetical protein